MPVPPRHIRTCRVTAMLAVLAAAPGVAAGQTHAVPVATGDVPGKVAQWFARAQRSAPGTWGVVIADQQGRVLWDEQPDLPLIPASTVKLLTTGYARSVLGADARRHTRVVGTGRVDATGTWAGSWALEVNGDPSLERPNAQGPRLVELAQELRKQGIRRLTGPFRVVSSDGPADAWYPQVWSTKHRGRLFAPPIGPVTLHENVVWFTVAPGTRQGAAPVVAGASPAGIESLVRVAARTVPGRRSRLGAQPDGAGGWLVTGTIGVGARPRGFALPAQDPKVVLQAAWKAALTEAGVEWLPTASGILGLSGELPMTIAEVASPPFDSLASEVNRRSLNYGAELLLQWAGGRYGGAAKLTDHVREVTGQVDGVHLVDGSGLSYDDRVSPRTFISYLARFPQTAAGRGFAQLLPENGTGTLRRLGAGRTLEKGVVRAKTGTLAMVSSVVGYLGRQDGVLLVSLMYNGPRVWAARQEQWKLFRLLGAEGVVVPADSTAAEPALGGE